MDYLPLMEYLMDYHLCLWLSNIRKSWSLYGLDGLLPLDFEFLMKNLGNIAILPFPPVQFSGSIPIHSTSFFPGLLSFSFCLNVSFFQIIVNTLANAWESTWNVNLTQIISPFGFLGTWGSGRPSGSYVKIC